MNAYILFGSAARHRYNGTMSAILDKHEVDYIELDMTGFTSDHRAARPPSTVDDADKADARLFYWGYGVERLAGLLRTACLHGQGD